MGLFPEWTWLVGFWIGAAIGSFLNVVVYRLPRGLKLSQPVHSFCPICKTRLRNADLVPLLSWLFLKRKCRYCDTPIPSRYFFVELITGILWAIIWQQQLVDANEPVKAVGYMLFSAGLVAAIFTDLAHYIIPDEVNAFLLVVGLGINGAMIALGDPRAWMWGMPSSIAGALIGWGLIWFVALAGRLGWGRDAMGHGDIKMTRGIGAVLLPASTFMSVGLAVFFGAVIGGVVAVLRSRQAKGEPEPEEAEEGQHEEPESIKSLFWCGLGYLLCIDVFGLFVPKLYEWWFGENPYSVEEIEENPRVELTMIPFGPFLAAGALGVVLLGPVLWGWWEAYWKSVTGG